MPTVLLSLLSYWAVSLAASSIVVGFVVSDLCVVCIGTVMVFVSLIASLIKKYPSKICERDENMRMNSKFDQN